MKRTCCLVSFLLMGTVIMPLAAQEGPGVSELKRVADTAKFENGMLFFKMKEYDRALVEFNEYLEIYINGIHRKEAYRNVGKIHFDRMDYTSASKAYISLSEEFNHTEEGVEAYYNLGICNSKMGYDAKALEIFKAIIEEYPDSNYAYQAKIQIEVLDIVKK